MSSHSLFLGVQVLMMFVFTLLAMNYETWLDSDGLMFLFWLLFTLFSWIGVIFYHYAFYLTMRDNLPRMVKVTLPFLPFVPLFRTL